ncbi:MAG TPA: lipoyl(octanoyl) transferase LipB [Candidatus Bathyarchaeia archaeon]|nr:lipoyl(octanoyl) transferase LipB [Candidatus Bathyarchaeia archaeon]
MKERIEVIRLPGFVPYVEGLRIQQARRDAVERGEAPETLFLLEHAPVITLGRKWQPKNLLRTRAEYAAMGIDLCETDRGGDVTCHGPGQMVAYPILNLNAVASRAVGSRSRATVPRRKPSIPWYLRALEEVLIRQLALYGLRASRCKNLTGVWVGDAKIAAIGVRIHNWTTSHGIALNVSPDMAHFRLIIPCGIADKPVTSLHALLGKGTPSMTAVMDDFERAFQEIF